MWGNARIVAFLKKQRDLYKYIHDQTLRLLNHGLTPTEIAEQIELPAESRRRMVGARLLRHRCATTPRRSTSSISAGTTRIRPISTRCRGRGRRANRSNTWAAPLRCSNARATISRPGEYRWVAEVTNQLVFADPANKAARELGADAWNSSAISREAATWRNAYLFGAAELRGGVPAAQAGSSANAGLLKGVSVDLAFDFLGVRLNAAKADGKHIVINWTFTDLNETYVINLENSALTHRAGRLADDADAGVKLTRAALDAITLKQRSFLGSIVTGDVSISGNPLKLRELFGMLDDFTPDFEIVGPLKASVQ